MSFLDILEMASVAIGTSGVLASIIWFICTLMHLPKTKRFRIFCWSWYLIALAYVTLFRYGLDMSIQFESIEQSINLIPIANTFKLYENGSVLVFYYNIIGNIMWFLPMGLLLGSTKLQFFKAIGSATMMSIAIEVLQNLLHVGTSDIDDVIFNTLGAMLGFLIAKVYIKQKSKAQ